VEEGVQVQDPGLGVQIDLCPHTGMENAVHLWHTLAAAAQQTTAAHTGVASSAHIPP
jgi:hypothetical protein